MELKEQEVKELMTKEKRKQDKAKRNIRPLKEINFRGERTIVNIRIKRENLVIEDINSKPLDKEIVKNDLTIRQINPIFKPLKKNKPNLDNIKVETEYIQLREYSQVKQPVQIVKIEADKSTEHPKPLRLRSINVAVVQLTDIRDKEKGYEIIRDVDFIKAILGTNGKRILNGKPLCIITEKHRDRYEYIIATICREIFREKKGGYPNPIIVSDTKDLEFKYKVEISGQIIIVENAEYSEELRKVLSKFPFSDLGFIILVSEKPEVLEEKILRNIPIVRPYLIRIEPIELEDRIKTKILEIIAGKKLWIESLRFGENFINATEFFKDTLKQYLDSTKAPEELQLRWHKLLARSPENLDEASIEHSGMKAFTWIYLYRKYKTLPELESEKGVDIRLGNQYYEIETFFGRDPISVLSEKVEKLKGRKISFVLRNISILIHLKELTNFLRMQRKNGVDIEIFGINFEKEKLISIKEIEEIIKEVILWKK